MMLNGSPFDKPNREESMKIYTKSGDQGETSLVDGSRVKKNHPRVEAYGTLDELNSSLGVCVALSRSAEAFQNNSHFQALQSIQNDLFNLGSQLACPTEDWRAKMPEVSETRVLYLEAEMDAMTDVLPPLKEFILPGGHPFAAALHQARSLCRRAERRVFELESSSNLENRALIYLNRLSDYLFVLARYANHVSQVPELTWKKDT